MEKKYTKSIFKNEDGHDISEIPLSRQKLLPYNSPLPTVQFSLHKSSSGSYRLDKRYLSNNYCLIMEQYVNYKLNYTMY